MGFFSDIRENFKKNNYDKDNYLNNFNGDAWKDLNIKQKKKCINLFEEEIAIKHGRPSVDIVYEDMDNYTYGSYNDNDQTIRINSKFLEKKQPYDFIYTVAHEQQHVFQYSSIRNKVKTEEQYLWKLNLLTNVDGNTINYYQPGKTNNEFKMYYLQPVEYNSNATALKLCKGIFSKLESKEFDKWISLKEDMLKQKIMDVYFENNNFQKDIVNCFEDRAKNIGYNLENLKPDIVNSKNIPWIKELENPEWINELEDMKKLSLEDTAPIDTNEVRAKLNESKKPLEKVLKNGEKDIEKLSEKKIYEKTEVNKIDNTKGIVHMYQLNSNPDKCFLGRKSDSIIKRLGAVALLGVVKKEFKGFKEFEKDNSKLINKEKIKAENLSL